MALFCRSLTVENHLLSYQEMRPKGGWCCDSCGGQRRGTLLRLRALHESSIEETVKGDQP
jgi:hypothetical protein